MKYANFNPLFTGKNCAIIWSIAAEKQEFERFNDSIICAYQKYFQNCCRSKKYAEYSPLITGA